MGTWFSIQTLDMIPTCSQPQWGAPPCLSLGRDVGYASYHPS